MYIFLFFLLQAALNVMSKASHTAHKDDLDQVRKDQHGWQEDTRWIYDVSHLATLR